MPHRNLGNSEDVVHAWNCNLRKSGMQWDWWGRGGCIGRRLGCFITEKLLAMGSRMASLAMSFMSGRKNTYWSIQMIDCSWLMDADWWRSTRGFRCDGNREAHLNCCLFLDRQTLVFQGALPLSWAYQNLHPSFSLYYYFLPLFFPFRLDRAGYWIPCHGLLLRDAQSTQSIFQSIYAASPNHYLSKSHGCPEDEDSQPTDFNICQVYVWCSSD